MHHFRYPLDGVHILAKRKAIRKKLLERGDLIPKKIAILSGSTIGEIEKILEVFLLDYGIKPEFWIGQYNQFFEDAVFGNGSLRVFRPEAIYIHTTNKNLVNLPCPSDSDTAVDVKLDENRERFISVWKALRSYSCPVIQNNFEPFSHRIYGNSDVVWHQGLRNFIFRMNSRLYNYASSGGSFYVNDIDYLAAQYGLDCWDDKNAWYMYKYAMSIDAIPLLCHSVASIMKSFWGLNKKALILDLDHTLWGGIIGDDGVQGIQIGAESPQGMAYTDFQRYVKDLSRAGVILSIASKNNTETAKQGFSHPASVLTTEDFACFTANWDPKSNNIAGIVEKINIRSDSVVFVDDNPQERDEVRTRFPEIETPAFTDPKDSVRMLDHMSYFESTVVSADDGNRARYYLDNAKRDDFKAAFSDYDHYLRSLEMTARVFPFSAGNMARVTQLINKTNQFNFTTRRLSEADVSAIQERKDVIHLAASLDDRFGDNGLVSVLVADIVAGAAEIGLWVMSCRVFQRKLEWAILDVLMDECAKLGVQEVNGIYIPSGKNGFVADMYRTLGFTEVSENQRVTRWRRAISGDSGFDRTLMRVIRHEQK